MSSKTNTCFYCTNKTEMVCEDCGKLVCNNHCNRGTPKNSHPCDDSIEGAHSMLRSK